MRPCRFMPGAAKVQGDTLADRTGITGNIIGVIPVIPAWAIHHGDTRAGQSPRSEGQCFPAHLVDDAVDEVFLITLEQTTCNSSD